MFAARNLFFTGSSAPPGAPTGVSATATANAAVVSFTAPTSTGGSPILYYTVTSSPGGFTASGTSSPVAVAGLTNGTAYTFTVTATNAVGTSPASAASNSVTPSYSPSFAYVGTVGAVNEEWNISVPINGSTIFVLGNSAGFGGTSTLYRSTNGGSTWTTGGSITGSGSMYGQGLLALSNTVVIAQNRGYIYRSTDAGNTFSLVLATGGSQGNLGNISSDGTYGVIGGYDLNVITSDGWVTASAISKPFGTRMATASLTNNGGNVFLHCPAGTSSPASNATIANASGSSVIATIAVGNNICSAGANITGFNAISSYNANSGTGLAVRYATYPSTSYTVANVTGMGDYGGAVSVTPPNNIIVAAQNGLYLVRQGTTPVQLSAATDWYSTCLAVSQGRNFMINANGDVYRY